MNDLNKKIACAVLLGVTFRRAVEEVASRNLSTDEAFGDALKSVINAFGAAVLAEVIMDAFGDRDVTDVLRRRYIKETVDACA